MRKISLLLLITLLLIGVWGLTDPIHAQNAVCNEKLIGHPKSVMLLRYNDAINNTGNDSPVGDTWFAILTKMAISTTNLSAFILTHHMVSPGLKLIRSIQWAK